MQTVEVSRKLLKNKGNILPGISTCTETGPAPHFETKKEGKKPFVMDEKQRDRVRLGGRNYAKMDSSDPFTFNRVMSHLNSGVSGFFEDEKGHRQEGFYDAKQSMETRHLPPGHPSFEDGSRTYNVTTFVDGKRP